MSNQDNNYLPLPELVERNISEAKAEEIKQRISLVKDKAQYYLGVDAYAMTEVKQLAHDAEDLLAEYERLVSELEEVKHENIILQLPGRAHELGE